jgi:hypothetical protein
VLAEGGGAVAEDGLFDDDPQADRTPTVTKLRAAAASHRLANTDDPL